MFSSKNEISDSHFNSFTFLSIIVLSYHYIFFLPKITVTNQIHIFAFCLDTKFLMSGRMFFLKNFFIKVFTIVISGSLIFH